MKEIHLATVCHPDLLEAERTAKMKTFFGEVVADTSLLAIVLFRAVPVHCLQSPVLLGRASLNQFLGRESHPSVNPTTPKRFQTQPHERMLVFDSWFYELTANARLDRLFSNAQLAWQNYQYSQRLVAFVLT